MNNFDISYKNLIKDILINGVTKEDRTGTGTKSVFGKNFVHDMKEGFPMLTLRKIHWNNVVTELLWFLNGQNDLRTLIQNNCMIWVGDALSRFKKLAKENDISREEFIQLILNDDTFSNVWGDLGPIYGVQWRKWKSYEKLTGSHGYGFIEKEHDQITNLIEELKNNPDSRRLLVNSYNVGDLSEMILPPCHYSFQVYTEELTMKEKIAWVMKNTDVELENFYITEEIYKDTTPQRKISLLFNMRSNDVPLGLPTNLASYGLLLEIIAKEVNMIPNKLIASIGDAHIYLNQIEQMKELLSRESYELPTLKFERKGIEQYKKEDFLLENYNHGSLIKIPLSN